MKRQRCPVGVHRGLHPYGTKFNPEGKLHPWGSHFTPYGRIKDWPLYIEVDCLVCNVLVAKQPKKSAGQQKMEVNDEEERQKPTAN
jgi:hypothetical protein